MCWPCRRLDSQCADCRCERNTQAAACNLEVHHDEAVRLCGQCGLAMALLCPYHLAERVIIWLAASGSHVDLVQGRVEQGTACWQAYFLAW